MATKRETVERILEALEPLPVRAHPMFGEYAVYCDDRVFGFVCDDTLFLKLVDEATELVAELPRGEAYPGSKPYAIADEDALARTEWLHDTVQTIASTQPQKRPKSRR